MPTGKRGKAGGIKLAASAEEAKAAAASILGMTIGEHRVETVLVEEQVAIAARDVRGRAQRPGVQGTAAAVLGRRRHGHRGDRSQASRPRWCGWPVDIRKGLDAKALERALPAVPGIDRDALVDLLLRLYSVYAGNDAELVEINPLVVAKDGRLVALDCKLAMDDSGVPRHEALAKTGTPDKLTELEARAKALDLKFIELDGSVGVLANGAGLTMTTMDAVRHYGGSPANFMEIGGESYTKAKPALELVLANPRVKCLLVNFCGAFARTDVMTEGVIDAWQALEPKIPVFFTIHGTNEDEAIAMVKARLGITPVRPDGRRGEGRRGGRAMMHHAP